MSLYIKLLSDISFEIGLIGYPEYLERCNVADWLDDPNNLSDPRLSNTDHEETSTDEYHRDEYDEKFAGQSNVEKPEDNEPPYLELFVMNQWMFTIGDADCYPSVPHGHFKSKMRKWPKLNPYNGRVFSDIHQESTRKRLDKKKMKMLWKDSKFVLHCRKQILWYCESFPRYRFLRATHGINVFPNFR